MSKSSKSGSKRRRRRDTKADRHIHKPKYIPPTAEELRSGLFNLPQELFDMVFNFVFSHPSSPVRYIGKLGYKPPIQLQINRHTREMFAAKYYTAEASWIFLCDYHTAPQPDTIGRWWRSLVQKTKMLLCKERPEELSPMLRADAKDPGKGRIFHHPYYPGPKTGFEFWYRWLEARKRGVGKLFEVLQFLPGSELYDGVRT